MSMAHEEFRYLRPDELDDGVRVAIIEPLLSIAGGFVGGCIVTAVVWAMAWKRKSS